MIRKLLIVLFAVAGLGLSSAAEADHVVSIYACNSNTVLIKMETQGWVYAWAPNIGSGQVSRIFNLALTALQTGHAIGYFNPATPDLACGIQASQITVLTLTNG